MTRLWARWVELTSRPTPVLPLALTRILVASVMLLDLLRVLQLGIVGDLWRAPAAGGIGGFTDEGSLLVDLPPSAALATYGITLVALTCVALGVAAVPATLVAVLADAQLGHLFPPGDRAIDRLLRTMLLLLVFSGWDKGLTLRIRHARATVAQWPHLLVRWMLVIVYTASGIGKVWVTQDWVGWARFPPLYRIVTDPMAGTLDPVQWLPFRPAFQVMSWSTIALELSSFLLLTRFGPWWGVVGALMHVGIFSMMELGMFSWGMLALYPIVFAPWIVRHARSASPMPASAWDQGSQAGR
jgi:hypothetical protein